MKYSPVIVASVVCLAALSPSAFGQPMEKVKVATTFLGLWDTTQPTFCKERGEFAKAGLDVEIVSTRGGSENVQAVVTGMDIGYSPGTNSVLAAYRQGAKIKIISTEFIGQNDSFFYVPSESPIKTINDIRGKTVAFSRPGGASEAILLALKAERKMDFNAISTGAMDATFTMTMTKQIDVGFSVPPSGLDAVEKGQIRVLFAGDDVESQAKLTGRVIIAGTDFLEKRRAVAQKFMQVLDQCVDWSYAHIDQSSQTYAALNKVTPAIAAKALAFYKREALAFGPVRGVKELIDQAVSGKFIEKPFTAEELADIMDIVYMPKK